MAALSDVQRQIRNLLGQTQGILRQHPLATRGTLVGGVTAFLILAYRDYQAFLALGAGGLPHNAIGWLINALVLRPLALSYSSRLYVGDYPNNGASKAIANLPKREGKRPTAAGIVPHRQMTDQATKSMMEPLRQIMTALVDDPEFSGKLEIRKSHYELHNDALYVLPSLLENDKELPVTARVAKGEITHVHPDRSIHVYLSAADARVLIEKGWGERHRLSRTWPFWMGWRQNLLGLGHTYLMIYGPRDEEELEVAKCIMREGVRFMLGKSARH